MNEYKHGNWYCKPANEPEAREVIERAVASGGKRQETLDGYSWDTFGVWGVYNGRTFTQDMDFYRDVDTTEYTIEQVREKFPLPGDHTEQGWNGEGLPPVGVECVVFHQGRWIRATTVGEFGYQKRCMVCAPNSGGFYGFYADEIRPLCTERERWVYEAQKHCTEFGGDQLGKLYDALKSGDLKAPEVE